MKGLIIFLSLISLLSFSSAVPHFTFSGIESFHDCTGEKGKIYLYIIGSLSEEVASASIANIKINKMGEFQCALSKNEGEKDQTRSHVITCSIEGNFEPSAHIIKEPKVNGFDFLNENGETTWPDDDPERATFLIGECGERVELDKEPLFSDNSERSGLYAGAYYKDPIKSIRKDVVDRALKFLPSRNYTKKDRMIEQMNLAKKLYSLTDMEAAYMVYKWEFQNLKYDCYNFEHDWSKIDFSDDGTYSSGVGVCDGFAKLYVAMCKGMGIDAYRVVGYSKGSLFTPGEIPDDSDHAWNAIRIDGRYYVLDVTWGIGSCNGEKYVPNLRDSYFCPKPEAMIRTHLPVDKKFQLVYPNLTLKQFVDSLMINMVFFENGMTKVTPDKAKFDSRGKFDVEIFYESSQVRNAFIYKLYFVGEDDYYYEEKRAPCWLYNKKSSAVLTCYTNQRGEYLLEVFGGPAGKGSYSQLFKYEIDSTRTAYKPLYFPSAYADYRASDMELMKPLYDPLIRGDLVNFELKTTSFDKLYVVSGDIEREMENNGKGVFTADSVYIIGDEVIIATSTGNQYDIIVKYDTELDKSAKAEPTYPQHFSSPKNVLYSPLMDTLKRGKYYNFKIKCTECKKLGVKDSENDPIYLTQRNGFWTGTVKIKGYGSVDIGEKIGYDFKVYYRYKTSS